MAAIWDAEKAESNVVKHRVRFAEAVLALEDPAAITVADHESSPLEPRFVSLGADASGRILVVVTLGAARTSG